MNSHYKLLIMRAAIKHCCCDQKSFLELNLNTPAMHVDAYVLSMYGITKW